MPSISQYPRTQRRDATPPKSKPPSGKQTSPNNPQTTSPPDSFKPESELVLEYDLSTKPMHSTGKALMCVLNNFDSVELAGAVRKSKERNMDSQTFYVYLALNKADIDPATFELWNTAPTVLFSTDNDEDGTGNGPKEDPDDGNGNGAYIFADDTPPPDATDEALAVFADQVGDQADPVDFKANFDISVSGSFNDPKKGNTRTVTIQGVPFPISDPRAG